MVSLPITTTDLPVRKEDYVVRIELHMNLRIMYYSVASNTAVTSVITPYV